jgi:hypothetical protein
LDNFIRFGQRRAGLIRLTEVKLSHREDDAAQRLKRTGTTRRKIKRLLRSLRGHRPFPGAVLRQSACE